MLEELQLGETFSKSGLCLPLSGLFALGDTILVLFHGILAPLIDLPQPLLRTLVASPILTHLIMLEHLQILLHELQIRQRIDLQHQIHCQNAATLNFDPIGPILA